MATTSYIPFSHLTQCQERLEIYLESGELYGHVLQNLTADIASSKLYGLLEQEHPLWKETPRDPKGYAVMLASAGRVSNLIGDYLTEKEIDVHLKMSSSYAMKSFLEDISDNPALQCFDMGVARRMLPSLLETSYEEAKEIIKDIQAQHSAVAAQTTRT